MNKPLIDDNTPIHGVWLSEIDFLLKLKLRTLIGASTFLPILVEGYYAPDKPNIVVKVKVHRKGFDVEVSKYATLGELLDEVIATAMLLGWDKKWKRHI